MYSWSTEINQLVDATNIKRLSGEPLPLPLFSPPCSTAAEDAMRSQVLAGAALSRSFAMEDDETFEQGGAGEHKAANCGWLLNALSLASCKGDPCEPCAHARNR